MPRSTRDPARRPDSSPRPTELHAVIMAGGAGTRFWPASRRHRPKQCLPLAHGRTLIRATVDRLAAVTGPDRTWIVTGPDLQAELLRALPGFPRARILVEPEPRDTAPCVAFASASIEAQAPGATLAFVPSDHVIEPAATFGALLSRAAALAADGTSLITFGIPPTYPATVYGYIERGPLVDAGDPPAYRALRFREKPSRERAAEFLGSGRFLWNSGVFVWQTRALLAAMEAFDGELAGGCRRMLDAAAAGDAGALARAFRSVPAISVDYAVMEKAPSVVVLESDLQWSDLGSFLALEKVFPADRDHNVVSMHGGARAVLEQSSDCIVWGEGRPAIALFGVRDLVVVATPDAVLVCSKHHAEELKTLVQRLTDAGMGDLL